MSVAIWYRVDVSAEGAPTGLGLPVTVSNDVATSPLAIDAELTVAMTEGAAAGSFEVTLINLPTTTAEAIQAVRSKAPVTVSIHLGYFDDPVTRAGDGGLVLTGRLTRVTGCVGADGYRRTVLSGQEEAGYLLRNTPAAVSAPDATGALEFAQALTAAAGVRLAPDSTLAGDLTGVTVRTGSTLDALRELAERADTPLVVRDGTVYLGAAVGAATDQAPVTLDPDTNIVSLDGVDGEDTNGELTPPVRSTLCVTVLGHPRLRVGQLVTVAGLTGVPTGPLRVSTVVHRFTTSGGYTAELGLIAAGPGERAQRNDGVRVVVDRLLGLVDRARDNHPSVDLGDVTDYTPGPHVASLDYLGDPDVALHDKPVTSVFAFDRTGLVVPVYPKMRALLAHDRDSVNGALLAGFLWPDDPHFRRPANRPGDYWLALPTGLGDDGLPAGPGANDLVDATGHRVVQVAGLRITVGADRLPEVGTRPDPPTDSSITIEHASGTTITVGADGAVTIATNDNPVTLTNGSVSLTLDGATVAVS